MNVEKGAYGYLNASKKRATIVTLLCLAICVGVYLTGLAIAHTNRNWFTIIAAVLCLPTGICAVQTIVFFQARPCSKEAYERIEACKRGLLIQYDLMMTGAEKNFRIAAAAVVEKQVACFSEDDALREEEATKHLTEQLSIGGYPDCQITVTKNLDDFCDKLNALEEIRAERNIDPYALERAWTPGSAQTIAGILRSISM